MDILSACRAASIACSFSTDYPFETMIDAAEWFADEEVGIPGVEPVTVWIQPMKAAASAPGTYPGFSLPTFASLPAFYEAARRAGCAQYQPASDAVHLIPA